MTTVGETTLLTGSFLTITAARYYGYKSLERLSAQARVAEPLSIPPHPESLGTAGDCDHVVSGAVGNSDHSYPKPCWALARTIPGPWVGTFAQDLGQEGDHGAF